MKRGRHPQRATYRSVARNVPPRAPRRGTNSRQEDLARKEKLRARRAGFWKKLGRTLRAVILLAFVTAVVGAGGWAAWQACERTGFLALREVEVTGNHLWDKTALLDKAGVELGTKLPFLPAGKIEKILRALPGMADVKVKRVYPSRLEIQVEEQQPVAMGKARGWRGLAPDGTALPGLDLRESDLPVIDGFSTMGEEARARLGAFLEGARRDYPALYASFSQLSWRGAAGRGRAASDGDEAEIVLRDGRLKVLIAMTNKSLNSLEFLQALLRQQGSSLEAGRTIDMSVEGYAYVR